MKSAFLPLGLVLAFVVAWLAPETGAALKAQGMIPWVVIGLFLINGYQTNLAELPRSRQFGGLLIVAILINIILAPLLGVLSAQAAALSAGATLGLIVKSAVPSTLSTCIVMTQLAGGYGLWALVMTLALNIIGVFTLPFVLDWALDASGTLSINPLALLQTLVELVLIPFIAGLLLRQVSRLDPQHTVLQYLPSLLVIAAVWMSLSSSSSLFTRLEWSSLLRIALASISVHLLLMVAAGLAGRLLAADWRGQVALVFTASQKTLPIAVSVLAALDGPVGEALLVCVLFHFLQLLIDSLLPGPVRRWCQNGSAHPSQA